MIKLELLGSKELYRINSEADYSEISLGKFGDEVDLDKLSIKFDNGGLEALQNITRGQELVLVV